jgi:hypothetical protein
MAVVEPILQYMRLYDGLDTSDSQSIYTSDDGSSNTQNLIKVGDTIIIRGSASNDGIFTVAAIRAVGDATDGDVYYVLSGRTIEDESSSVAINIQVYRMGNSVARSKTGDRMVALGNVDTTNSGADFPAIDIWAFNDIGTASNENDAWAQNAIMPTFSGDDAKYIFYFSDGVLRVCDINGNNTSMIKWYGWVERNQFGLDESPSFIEWQDHPNFLPSPRTGSGGYCLGTYLTSHTSTVLANYHNNNRGTRYVLKNGTSNLQTDGSVDNSQTEIGFDDTSGVDVDDQIVIGQVYTIGSALTAAYTELLFARKAAIDAVESTFVRNYGSTSKVPDTYNTDETPVVQRGVAWNIAVTEDTSEGEWGANDWEFWESFIYDGNQESLPVQVSDGALTTNLAAGVTSSFAGDKALKVSIYADLAYPGRVSGGRIYIREEDSEDDLIMLADIDIVKGVRLSLDDAYESWALNTTNTQGAYVSSLITKTPNLDTYKTINGFGPKVDFVGIGRLNESYQCSTVSNRRTFIANMKVLNKNGELIKYGDRIMFSEMNKFDTFISDNFIDVSKGDYGEYVALESYSDRLLAFKHNLVQIINIASPSPSNWFLEETIQYAGVNFSYSVARVKNGIVWANQSGCFLYDGSKVTNLLDNKIAVREVPQSVVETWSDFAFGTNLIKDPMVGYDSLSNQLIVMRSPNDETDSSNLAFIYDFDTKGWVYNTNMFSDSGYYTNFVHDWDNSLIVGKKSDSDSISFHRYSPIAIAQGSQELITKDIDFGSPGITKKIYKVYVTYKSGEVQANPMEYSVDGKGSWTDITTGAGTITTDAGDSDTLPTASAWDVAVFKFASPISCQSIQLKFNPPDSALMEINDMTIEYREIRSRGVR